nr:UvrD-helicase domain-containing protein [Azospirillum argentinense]
MRLLPGRHPSSQPWSRVTRTTLASVLFAVLRPTHARAATLDGETMTLVFATGEVSVPVATLEAIAVDVGWLWANLRLRAGARDYVLSGVAQRDARGFANAGEAARVAWWTRALSARAAALRSVRQRIAQLADPPRYMAHHVFSALERDARAAIASLPAALPKDVPDSDEVRALRAIRDFLNDPEGHRARANAAFVVKEPARSKDFFDRVETKPLTDEQRRAVVVDEDRTLVVAAAGSGKTSVIVAKAGWLVWKRYRPPAELLMLAFATDARAEMEQRIRKRLGDAVASGLTVRTFHGLGMAIIGEAEGKRPTLATVAEDDKALFDLLKSIVADLLADPAFSRVMVTWFQSHFAPYKSASEFRNHGEYWSYIRANDIRSLKGEKLKSFEECEIANFLFLNGVPYEYERPYEHETATPDRRQYQPDFYLPDAGIYIEHFALSASGNTPPFIDREEYRRSMAWKRRLHADRGTVLIETFSHEKAAGRLTDNLATKLAAHGVALSPIRPGEVFAILESQGRVSPFTRLVATFLQHFKGGHVTLAETSRRAAARPDRPRAEAFLAVFGRIFERYQGWLAARRQIDFHDMILKATEHVETGRYTSPFGYILVDEFQDISPGRARLLKALLDQSPSNQLFAVGDDWQAIYRFAGSDIAVMRGFADRFGASARVDLGTTFRCADRIAATATRFVLKNPAQLRKDVTAVARANGPCVHIGLPGAEGSDLLRKALRAIAAETATIRETATVLLLGRYRHTQPRDMDALAREHPGLRLSFMTVHGAKGLEADYAIVLGLGTGRFGFPTEIADDPILDLVLAAPEGYPNAEERRLLYVALPAPSAGSFSSRTAISPRRSSVSCSRTATTSPCSAGRRRRRFPARGAWKGDCSAATAHGGRSTGVRTGPTAGTPRMPALTAAPACRSAPMEASGAWTAASRSRSARDVTAGSSSRAAGMDRS